MHHIEEQYVLIPQVSTGVNRRGREADHMHLLPCLMCGPIPPL